MEKGKLNTELQFKKIETIINTIRTIGRENYKQEYKNIYQISEPFFKVLNHKGINSKLIDDFLHWKDKLNEQLI